MGVHGWSRVVPLVCVGGVVRVCVRGVLAVVACISIVCVAFVWRFQPEKDITHKVVDALG